MSDDFVRVLLVALLLGAIASLAIVPESIGRTGARIVNGFTAALTDAASARALEELVDG